MAKQLKPKDAILVGLYDTDGILRFTGADREACLAYAELFELKSIECSLMSLPEPNQLSIKGQKRVPRAMSNS